MTNRKVNIYNSGPCVEVWPKSLKIGYPYNSFIRFRFSLVFVLFILLILLLTLSLPIIRQNVSESEL